MLVLTILISTSSLIEILTNPWFILPIILLITLCLIVVVKYAKHQKPNQSLVRKRLKQTVSQSMDLSDVEWTDKKSIEDALLKLNGRTYSTLNNDERNALNRAISLHMYRVDWVLSKEDMANIHSVLDVEPVLLKSNKLLKVKPRLLSKNVDFGMHLLRRARSKSPF